mmetsp:Transcript_43849/g.59906  ORF Transcript_43849/g.59906 Transcript_43849/m.59906 type:complete len:259 (+) Transcript_43849:871-1647(+)
MRAHLPRLLRGGCGIPALPCCPGPTVELVMMMVTSSDDDDGTGPAVRQQLRSMTEGGGFAHDNLPPTLDWLPSCSPQLGTCKFCFLTLALWFCSQTSNSSRFFRSLLCVAVTPSFPVDTSESPLCAAATPSFPIDTSDSLLCAAVMSSFPIDTSNSILCAAVTPSFSVDTPDSPFVPSLLHTETSTLRLPLLSASSPPPPGACGLSSPRAAFRAATNWSASAAPERSNSIVHGAQREEFASSCGNLRLIIVCNLQITL